MNHNTWQFVRVEFLFNKYIVDCLILMLPMQ
jgi:hypothetical protein